ncbi:hypothetical protein HanPSC8_Chr12g0512571 [Helianthus annuus]|nr:hypothetical protein HanPSC8_Chr12g0512571 [Helianthus annuus]
MPNTGYEILKYPKQMIPSLLESGARWYIVKFLQDYIVYGTLIVNGTLTYINDILLSELSKLD